MGSWTIKLIARSAVGIVNEVDYAVTVTTGGTARCAMPEIFDCNGNILLNSGGDFTTYANWQQLFQALGVAQALEFPNGTIYFASVVQPLPWGALKLACTTPGATINFATDGPLQNGAALLAQSANGSQDAYVYPAATPFHAMPAPATGSIGQSDGYPVQFCSPLITGYCVYAYASAPGFTNSFYVVWFIPLFAGATSLNSNQVL